MEWQNRTTYSVRLDNVLCKTFKVLDLPPNIGQAYYWGAGVVSNCQHKDRYLSCNIDSTTRDALPIVFRSATPSEGVAYFPYSMWSDFLKETGLNDADEFVFIHLVQRIQSKYAKK